MRKRCKDCVNCKFFKNTETVMDGYIEHKDDKGNVWMLEPKRKEVPRHCTEHPERFEKWWEIVKNLPSSDHGIEPDCDDYEMREDLAELLGPMDTMLELLDEMNRKLSEKENG